MASGDVDIAVVGDHRATGGIERCFANMIPVWDRLGYRVDVVGFRNAVPFYPDELPSRVGFTHLHTRSRLATLFALRRYLHRYRPRAVIATGHVSNVILARTRRWSRDLPGQWMLNVQNDFVASRKDPTGRKRARKLREVRRIYPAADGLITTSRGVADNLTKHAGLGGLTIEVIPTGVITPDILRQAEEPVSHPWLAADRDRPVAVGVGRLAAQKDFPTLLRAFARVRDAVPARLLILGEGPERVHLEELARELGVAGDVALPGFVENPYAWMRKADVFVLSSAWEGFGNVVAEALGLGVPVVTTDCPSGPAEIVGYGRYGSIAPVGDPTALAEAVIETLTGHRQNLNLEEIRQPLTNEHAARAYLRAFRLPESGAGRS